MTAAHLVIEHFTDPACPWAFSAEPARLRLRWLYGDQLVWHDRMVVLSEAPEDYVAKGLTTEQLASGLRTIRARFAMPIDPLPRRRMTGTVHACRAVVAARLHAPGRAPSLLRRLRVRGMAGELIDEPDVIAGAAREAGLDPAALGDWLGEPAVEEALRADMAAARAPSPAARALDHKLAGPDGARRYTCPSYEISRPDGARIVVPGFQPIEAYEVAIANLAPELARRADPESVLEVLEWADEPLAGAEVAALCGLDLQDARDALARVAHEEPVGADGYWSLPATSTRLAA